MKFKWLVQLIIFSWLLFSMPTFAQLMSSNTREIIRDNQSLIWQKQPTLSYTNSDLAYKDRDFNCLIYANRDGVITSVKIIKSTGLDKLDQKIVKAVYQAKLINPYQEDVIAEQPFQLESNEPKGLFQSLFEFLFKK